MKKIAKILIAVCLGIAFPVLSHAFSVVVFSDIHAGKPKFGSTEKYDYEKDIKKMPKGDVTFILGDNGVVGGDCKKIQKIMANKGKTFWVKGNHDSAKCMEYLKTPRPYYYIYERGNTRFIILDTSVADGKGNGEIDGVQLNWLLRQLKTSKQVVLMSHHPISNMRYARTILEKYKNIKYAFSGHLHNNNSCKIKNGIKYCSLSSLTLPVKGKHYMKVNF